MATQPTVFFITQTQQHRQIMEQLLAPLPFTIEVYSTPRAFFKAYDPSRRGCILLEDNLPEKERLAFETKLRQKNKAIPVLYMIYTDETPATRISTRKTEHGSTIQFLKGKRLIDTIKLNVAKDCARLSNDELKVMAARLDLLMPREREITEYLVLGNKNKRIAYELGLSIKTVEQYRSNLMNKLKVKSLYELIKLYLMLHPSF